MVRLMALTLGLGLAGPVFGAESVVWQIGQPDHSYAEFALAGDHEGYRARFAAKPVVFEVGRSQPGRDWPFIHPGPADGWAGTRVHPFTIRFSLPDQPQGVFTLAVEFSDTHGRRPPEYAISINGRTARYRLPRGGGDASLRKPEAGKPYKIEVPLVASLLRQGSNAIVLACRDGSWVQYDAITLRHDPSGQMPEPAIRSVGARPTPMFLGTDGQTRRAVQVTVGLTAPAAELQLRVAAGGQALEVPVAPLPLFGDVEQDVGVPDSPKPLQVTVTAVMGQQSKSTTITVPPQRKWRVFVAPSAHTDIGYTDVQPKCRQRHNENLDLAAELMGRDPDFKWNCEVAWQAENYLADRKGEQLERFLRLARERRLGVQALYCNILTGLCSPEELCRLTAFAYRLHREYGIPYGSAMINDVPTWVGALPMVLAGSGIRYFSGGSNNTRAVTFRQLYDQSPFWWEGPDGSRVLMMSQPSYAYAARMGLLANVETARRRLLAHLAAYEARPYPFDAIYLNGAVSDNQPLNPRLAQVAAEWNRRYAFPKLILCHNAEFYQYIEQKYGDRFPVYRGSGGTYWEDGAGSSARETAMCRDAHAATNNAERLFAIAHALRPESAYPSAPIQDAWRNAMLYDEHTWGAHCSISQPESAFTKAQWKIKAQFAHDAWSQSHGLLDRAVKRLAAMIRTQKPSLVVVNPMSWPREDVVAVQLAEGTGVADPALKACRVDSTTLLSVRDVPACGYRVLPIGPQAEIPVAQPAEGTAIESRYYRVTFDPASGAITSVVDKELGRQLVDPQAPYRLNHYLYVAGGKGTSIERAGRPAPKLTISTPQQASLRALNLGELGQRMIVHTSATMTPEIITEVTVYNDVKRIDITNRVTKDLTYDKEAVYFAFPFAAAKPTIRYEEPCAIVQPDRDLLPGACRDWFTVQHFVQIAAQDVAITWSTPDAPLVCLEDINRGKWQTALPVRTGRVYAYVMNNYWFTNYLAGQGGRFTFRFSITSSAKPDTVASAHFGWGVSNPLVPVAVRACPDGLLPADRASLVDVAEPNVLLIAMKKANTSDAWVLRLWEMTGQATTAHVRLPHLGPTCATLCNLVEVPQDDGRCQVRGGTIEVPVRAHGLATVLIE